MLNFISFQTKKKKPKARKKKRTQRNTPQLSSKQLEEVWESDVAPSLSSILQGNEVVPEHTQPLFDPTSDVPDEEQRCAIQTFFISNQLISNCPELYNISKQF